MFFTKTFRGLTSMWSTDSTITINITFFTFIITFKTFSQASIKMEMRAMTFWWLNSISSTINTFMFRITSSTFNSTRNTFFIDITKISFITITIWWIRSIFSTSYTHILSSCFTIITFCIAFFFFFFRKSDRWNKIISIKIFKIILSISSITKWDTKLFHFSKESIIPLIFS